MRRAAYAQAGQTIGVRAGPGGLRNDIRAGCPVRSTNPIPTMNLESLKGKTLDAELFEQLAEHVAGLNSRAETAEGKARTAQKETIEGRKQLKAERDAAFEKLGVTSLDELEALPDGKGASDAARQFEAKLKRAEREKAEAMAALQDLQGKYTKDRRDLALEKAIASQPFIDSEDARALLERRIKAEGDDFLFETTDGKLVTLADGAAFIAKTKAHLVKAPGNGATGSGFKPGTTPGATNGGQQGGPTLDAAAIYAARNPNAQAGASA